MKGRFFKIWIKVADIVFSILNLNRITQNSWVSLTNEKQSIDLVIVTWKNNFGSGEKLCLGVYSNALYFYKDVLIRRDFSACDIDHSA